MCFFFFKLKTAYELRISDWSSDVCSSDLSAEAMRRASARARRREQTVTSGAAARQSETAFGDHAAQHFAGTTVDRCRRRMAIALLDQTQAFLAAYQRLRRGKIEQIGRVDDARRSAERRVGQDWVSPCRSRWSRSH